MRYFAQATTSAAMARKKSADLAAPTEETIQSEMPAETLAPEVEEIDAPETGKTKVKGDRLTGQALLDYVNAHKDDQIEEVLFATGYYTIITDDETGESVTRYHKQPFFTAMTEASTGISFAPVRRAYTSRKGRQPVVKLGKIGNCVVGSRYTGIAGFAPESRVLVTAEEGKITLTAYTEEGGADAQDDQDDLDL